MEVADIVCLASPGGLARVVFVNEKQLSAALHGFARLWIAVLILVPTALAATQLWLAIEHRDHSKCPARLETWLAVDGALGLLWVVLSVADLAWVQRRIAGAAEAGIHAGTERARRAEFLGTWVWIGVTTTLVLPVARLVVLLWGVHALAAAGGGAALDVFVRPLPSSPGAYGGCAPLMAAVMAYYFAVVAAIMLVVVAGLAGLLATCAARACCPARRGARGSPPEPDPERVPLTSAAVGEGGVDHKTS